MIYLTVKLFLNVCSTAVTFNFCKQREKSKKIVRKSYS